MWYLIFAVLLIGVMAMMPKPNIENARKAKLGDFQFPRAGYGDPVTIVWGKARIKSPVVIWFGDFRAKEIQEKVKTGLFSSKKVTTGYKNYLGVDCLLCIGPNIRLRRFWAGKDLAWSGNISTETTFYVDNPNLFGGEKERGGLQGTVAFYPGNADSTQDGYLASLLGAGVPKYNGFCRLVFRSFYIGTTTNPEPWSFEVESIPTSFAALGSHRYIGDDLNPALIAYDCLTQANGKFSMPESALDSDSFVAAGNVMYSEGLGMSMVVQNTISGKDILEEVMRHCDGVMYKDPATAKVKIKLIRNDYDIEDLQDVDMSDIVEVSSFSKTLWADTFNQSRVTFTDRATNYETSVAIAQDFGNINYQQRVRSSDISIPGAYTATVANKLAARHLSIISVPLYKCELICKRTVQGLRPGDVFKFSYEPYGISGMIMRVTKIDLGTLEDGKIRLTCIQDKFASNETTFNPPDSSGWSPITTSAQQITIYKLMPAPFFLARSDSAPEAVGGFASGGRYMALADKPSSSSIAFDVRSSSDAFASVNDLEDEDASYVATGALVSNYPASTAKATGHDSGGIVVKNISSSDIEKIYNWSSYSQAANGSGLIMINGELMVYVGVIDHGDGTVTLPSVYRAVLDTAFEDHLAEDRVWFIDGKTGTLPTIYGNGISRTFKLLDNTNRDVMAVATATSFAVTQDGRASKPMHPQYLTLQASRTPAAGSSLTSVAVAWRRRSRDVSLIPTYDSADAPESGVDTRLRWKIDSGAWTTTYETGASASINVTGLTGVLTVEVAGRISATGVLSQSSDSLTMTLA